MCFPFYLLTVRISQKQGQKKSLMTYVKVALVSYIGVLVLLLMWKQGDPARNLSIMGESGLSLNLYKILFILCFGLGYGDYYVTDDMPILMVAWALTLWSMKGYELDGVRIKTIQAVNAARKEAIAGGMTMDEAIATITEESIK